MKLSLEKKKETLADKAHKGAIVVGRSNKPHDNGRVVHYLIIENCPEKYFVVVNLDGDNLMPSSKGETPKEAVEKLMMTFKQLDFTEIIPANEFELVRK